MLEKLRKLGRKNYFFNAILIGGVGFIFDAIFYNYNPILIMLCAIPIVIMYLLLLGLVPNKCIRILLYSLNLLILGFLLHYFAILGILQKITLIVIFIINLIVSIDIYKNNFLFISTK